MPNFDHILFPMDFSCQCQFARPFVKAMAQKCGSRVTLMHVIQPLSGVYGTEDLRCIMRDMEAAKQEAYERLAGSFQPWLSRIDTIVEIGDPAVRIAEYARASKVDLIMMPTHGHGRFRHFLFGSITAKILHDLPCPVWTCARLEDPDLAAQAKCESLLCALDLEDGSLELLTRSAELASRLKATLRIVHAAPYAQAWIDPPFSDQYCNQILHAAHDHIAGLQRKAETTLEVWAEALPVAELVRRAALYHKADLVLIGRGKLHQKLGGLRTNAYGIIGSSPCPVISF
jgi:nucleotide-binding universal stress UspA family protein